jgi:hypothetical protein
MKRMIVSVLAMTALFGVNAALANEASGNIKTINPKRHEVVLKDGKSYWFLKKVDLSKNKVGDKVKITYEMAKTKKGKDYNRASAIEPTS